MGRRVGHHRPGMNEAFTGCVTGSGNTIPDRDEEDGNREGAVCPQSLEFLIVRGAS